MDTYEKKYKDLLERARKQRDENCDGCKMCLESLFPELQESEDERIRKTLIRFHKSTIDMDGIKGEEIIAWLEKQGEQKEYTFKSLPRLLDMIEPTSKAKAYCQKLMDTLVNEGYATDAKIVGECLTKMDDEKVALATMDEKQASKPKWSEKDERILYAIIADFKAFKYSITSTLESHFDECLDWLKSLKKRMEES